MKQFDLFSAQNDQERVALILKKGVEKSLVESNPNNERLIRARFFGIYLFGMYVRMTIIQCYAPTNDAHP